MTSQKWKIIFMGTPQFAVPSLEALIKKERVIAVYTQPSRPRGRGQKTLPPPIKEYADAQGIPCFQPKTLRSAAELSRIQQLKPDLIVVAAYGLFIPKDILAVPGHKAINVHPSLLPKYRGAAPIQWALIHGDQQTGTSIITVASRMDAGDILTQQSIPIEPADNFISLQNRLSEISAQLLMKTIAGLKQGTLHPRIQNEQEVITTRKLTREDGRIDWRRPARQLLNLIRGANPWPGTFTTLAGEDIKVHAAEIYSENFSGHAGRIHKLIPEGIIVETPQGLLLLTEVQRPNKRRMSAADFFKGHKIRAGSFLGTKINGH